MLMCLRDEYLGEITGFFVRFGLHPNTQAMLLYMANFTRGGLNKYHPCRYMH